MSNLKLQKNSYVKVYQIMKDKYFSINFISKKDSKSTQINVKASSSENAIEILKINDLFLETISEPKELPIKPDNFIE